MTKFNRITGNQCPPLPRKSREIKFAHSNQPVTPTVNTKTWCIAHRPDWMCHPEEHELIRSKEYWMYPYPKTCPLGAIQSIQVGDEVNIRVRTCIGAKGVLKRPAYKGYYRRGVVTRCPRITEQDFDAKGGWYCMQIEWSPTIISRDECDYKNAPCKTLTIQ
jgi:hypothetical protein